MRGGIIMMMLGLTLPASAAEIGRFVSGENAFAVNSWLVPTRTGIVRDRYPVHGVGGGTNCSKP